MTVGERIKKRRKELGLTQEELAKRLGNSSRASICTVEKDREGLTTARIEKFAQALETTPAYLLGWTSDHTQEFYRLMEKNGVIDRETIDSSVFLGYYPGNESENENINTENESDFLFSLSPKERKEIVDLYRKYKNATTDIRSAIDLLLKAKNNTGSKED